MFNDQMKLTAIILTGGKSSRMGRDKALVKVDGQTLLERATGFCSSIANEVLISSDSEVHGVNGIKTIPDEYKDCGPMGGIYSCLKESANEWCFVLSVDAPFVEKELLNDLIRNAAGFDAVVPVHSGKKEPLIALYHKQMLPELRKELDSGSYKLQILLQKVNTCYTDVTQLQQEYPRLFSNINFLEDLDQFQ